jgi:hypothetical protein
MQPDLQKLTCRFWASLVEGDGGRRAFGASGSVSVRGGPPAAGSVDAPSARAGVGGRRAFGGSGFVSESGAAGSRTPSRALAQQSTDTGTGAAGSRTRTPAQPVHGHGHVHDAERGLLVGASFYQCARCRRGRAGFARARAALAAPTAAARTAVGLVMARKQASASTKGAFRCRSKPQSSASN